MAGFISVIQLYCGGEDEILSFLRNLLVMGITCFKRKGDGIMNLVTTAIVWYQRSWWIGLKEIVFLLAFVITAITYRRNTKIRLQDVQANRVQRTYAMMVGYPGETRALVLTVTKQLEIGFRAVEELKAEGTSEALIAVYLAQVINESDLISLLHLLDPWGFLLLNSDYLFVDEALNTFASEVRRLLLDVRFKEYIDRILSTSTMQGISVLQWLLVQHQSQYG